MHNRTDSVITSIQITEDNNMVICFNDTWYQEDIAELVDCVLARLIVSTKREFVVGADNACARFQWKNGYFLLNFECYSQSCWLAAEDLFSQNLLPELHAACAGSS